MTVNGEGHSERNETEQKNRTPFFNPKFWEALHSYKDGETCNQKRGFTEIERAGLKPSLCGKTMLKRIRTRR